MGIDRHIIGLYGVWSMVGIEVRGMGLLEWVVGGSGYFESGLQHSSAPESCATQPRRTVSDDCSYSTPRTPWLSFGTISYASLSVITRLTCWCRKTACKSPLKPLHQDPDIWLHLLREIRYRSNSVRHGELSSP